MFSFEDAILLPDGGDAHVNDSHIGHLGPQLLDHPCKASLIIPAKEKAQIATDLKRKALTSPLAILETAIRPVRLDVEFKLELHLELHKSQYCKGACLMTVTSWERALMRSTQNPS